MAEAQPAQSRYPNLAPWHWLINRLARPPAEEVEVPREALGSIDVPELVVVHQVPTGEVARAGLILLGLGLGVYLLWRIQEVLFLLFLAILLATTIEPLVERLRQGPFSRGTGVLVVYTVIVVALGLPAIALTPSLVAQAASFTDSLPARIEALRPYAERLQPTPVQQVAVNALNQAAAELRQPVAPKGETIVAAGATVIRATLDFLLVFVLAFYWLMERSALKRSLLRAVPRHRAKEVNAIWIELEDKLGAWVRGQLVLMVVIGAVAGLGFVVLGLPNPLVLAIAAALGEMIPIVGPYLAFAPAVLVTLATTPEKILLVVAYAVVVQLVESNVLVPRVMNQAVGISPLTIILGIQIGAILYGLPGALLAVPVAAACQVILAHTLGAEGRVQAAAHAAPPPE